MKWTSKVKILFSLISIFYFINLLSSASLILSLCLTDSFEFSGIGSLSSEALFIFFNLLFAIFVIASIYFYYKMKKIVDAYIEAIEANENLAEQNKYWHERSLSLVSQNNKLIQEFDTSEIGRKYNELKEENKSLCYEISDLIKENEKLRKNNIFLKHKLFNSEH